MIDTPPGALVGQAFAVAELETAKVAFERLGLVLSDRAVHKEWGIETATFGFADGTYLELASPTDTTHTVGATLAAFIGKRGDGAYMSTFEVDDVHRFHVEVAAAGVAVAAPPQAIPPGTSPVAEALWLKPAATAGAFMQFIQWNHGRPVPDAVSEGVDGLFTDVIAVADVDDAVRRFESLGFAVWSRYRTTLWGLETAVLRLGDGTNLEIVAPVDSSRPAAAAVARALSRQGRGHYMTVLRCPDVDRVHRRLRSSGVATLGPPSTAPPESPWGPVGQLWPHPGAVGAFIEFLSVPPAG